MGLCSVRIDLTSHITLVPGTKFNYTLPGGPFVDASDAGGSSSPILNVQPDTLKWPPPSSLAPYNTAFSSSIINMTMIALTQFNPGTNLTITSPYDRQWHPLAVTCAIHPCLRNYHGAVTNNILNETLLSTVPAIPAAEGESSENGFHSSTTLQTTCPIDGVLYTPSNFSVVPSTRTIPGPSKYSPDTVFLSRFFEGVLAPDGHNVTAPYECIYKLYWVLYLALYYFFNDYLFTGPCFHSADALETTPNCPDQVFWLNAFWENGNASVESVQKTMDGFVKAATDRMRVEGGGGMYDGRFPGEELPFEKLVVKGVGLDTTVCVEFDKWWLALPVGLLALGVLLLVVVLDGYLDVDENGQGRQPVWKSSLLPLMYCGFLGGGGTPWRSVPEQDELEKLAKREKAVLSVGDGSVGFIKGGGLS